MFGRKKKEKDVPGGIVLKPGERLRTTIERVKENQLMDFFIRVEFSSNKKKLKKRMHQAVDNLIDMCK